MQFAQLKRREAIALLGGAVAAWPLVARGQQAALPLIGYLHSASPKPNAHLVAAFRQGLKESGFVEGENVVVEYRWADGRYERLPTLAADLVSRQAAVIVAQGGTVSIRAASAATTAIPIVFSTGGDPVKEGLVASFNRPGGNVTGVSLLTTGLGARDSKPIAVTGGKPPF
jgi:putative tryptophan/tyrosine transport system substrate-binding protein